MSDPLEVRRDGVLIAHLTGSGSDIACTYSPEMLDTHPGGTPVLSCSLPVQSRPGDATGWARGLLPEGQHLHSLAAAADVAASDTFGLLARYGRDIAGAFEIVPANPPPRTPSYVLYADGALDREIADIEATPLGIHDDSELSIAGLQNKLVVVDTPDGWARPQHGYPSTHIIKLDPDAHPGLVDAEAACLHLAAAAGLTSITARLESFGDRRALIVSRFDRSTTSDGSVVRSHQEDLLQALGISPDDRRGRAKYQAPGTAGPPSWWHVADLLDSYSADASAALDQLVRIIVFTTVIGNADCHAKNVALLLGDSVELAPLYDTVPTALWPKLRSDAALAVNDVVSMTGMTLADVVDEATRWRHRPARSRQVAVEFAELLLALAADIVRLDVAALVTTNAQRLLATQ